MARRVLQALGSLWVATLVIWGLTLLAPGDPARRVLQAGGIEHPTAGQIEVERAALGLDRPALLRYLEWLAGAVRGDLGISYRTGRPVSADLAHHLPATLLLTAVALTFAVAVSVLLAAVSAVTAGRAPDLIVRGVCVLVAVLPGFLVGTLLIDLVVLRWGHARVIADGTWRTVALPAFTLALLTVDGWTRALRALLLDALDAPFLVVARARGATATVRLLRHALPNALVPFLALVGIGVASLLGGAVVIESVFTWPGIGRYAVEAITARDLPAVQGFTLIAVTGYVLTSLLVDLLSGLLDPRTLEESREPAGAMSA